ncbi:MAG: hypothetical protein AAB576_11650 [Elusimicrobiota bacterium]
MSEGRGKPSYIGVLGGAAAGLAAYALAGAAAPSSEARRLVGVTAAGVLLDIFGFLLVWLAVPLLT